MINWLTKALIRWGVARTRGDRRLIGILLVLGMGMGGLAPAARAEGSRDLTDNPGSRPYLEFRNDQTSGILRRTVIQVFAQPGETINLGSSATGVTGITDIAFRRPDGSSGTCGPGVGNIPDRAAELAGPGIGYTPCSIEVEAGQGGIWEIDFQSPNPNSNQDPPPIAAGGDWAQANDQGWVVAWDVTVSQGGALGAGGTPVLGRVFANYLALNMGGQGSLFNGEVTVLTRDGYRYRVEGNGLDPFGFIFFANREGFLDADGTSLFRSIPAPIGQPIPVHSPALPDNEATNDITHKLFLNPPAADLPSVASSPSGITWLNNPPTPPPTATNFEFIGIEGTPGASGNNPLGGTFSFNATASGTATIVIDLNGDGIFGNANDRILLSPVTPGANTIFWDGNDGNGNPAPAGAAPYDTQIELTAGEAHFPFLDAENNASGIVIERLNQPPGALSVDPFTIFYDDSDLTGAGAPNPIQALPPQGVSSAGGGHAFTSNFGDNRGIDTWVLFPAPPVALPGGILVREADLIISKTRDVPNPVPGSSITYTVVVQNNGPSDALGAEFTDTLPPSLSNVTWTCVASLGSSCTDSGSGNAIVDPAVNLLTNGTATYTITADIAPNATGDLINTATIRRPADVTDPIDNDNSGGTNETESATDVAQLVPSNPVVGLTKQASTPINNGDGSFTIPYSMQLFNLGNTPLVNVQIEEDLTSTFLAPASFTIIPGSVASNGIAANPNFTGSGAGTNLLTAGQTLAVNGTATVQFNVRVVPNGNLGPFENSAIANATSPTNQPTTDISNDGTEVDPNGNGNPNEPGENTPTVVSLPEVPSLGVAKRVVNVVNNGDGTYDVQYELRAQNYGNIPLQNIQLLDDLATQFGGAVGYTILTSPSTTGSLVANPAFNGDTNPNLLNPGSTLGLGQSETIAFAIRVTPGANLGPYLNSVLGEAETPSGVPTDDLSTNGDDPDPNGDGIPDEDVPTPVQFAETPVIGTAKQATQITNNNDGTYDVVYDIVVTNLGGILLNDVQVTDDFSDTFDEAVQFEVLQSQVVSGGLAANPAYDGVADLDLLAPGQSLPISATSTIRVVVQVTPGANLGPYLNQAIATGISPANVPVSDLSNPSINPDPNGNGIPNDPGEDDPTPVVFPEGPVLGVAKQRGTVTPNGDGTFNVPFNILVENLGDVPIQNIQIEDDLFGRATSTFDQAESVAIALSPRIESGPLTAANPNFDGNGDRNLLSGTETLAVGQRAIIRFIVQVNPGTQRLVYQNNAIGTGLSPSGTPVNDISTDQTGQTVPTSDPDSDGDPSNNSTPTPIRFDLDTSFRLVKRITNVVRNGVPLPGLNFGQFTNNSEDAATLNSAGLTPIGLLQIPEETRLQSGDIVEYTLYFSSDGTTSASNVQFCDQIPVGTDFIPNTFGPQQGIQYRAPGSPNPTALTNTADNDPGRFFTPLAPLPDPCGTNDNNGAVFVNLGEVPVGQPGLVRFNTRIP
ncbi:MAG: DUF11 domain-containing protein [Kaiparowitsia implicata GSE-PSE-MK54-09C]|jgi:uncharacterized repeat protein (TIGR01451 family)|nr:DUF11 domain-containing protein [Kaiparowitsia implicata GSE-PSE-MK54-09C]